jgi:hypothetical protein
MLPATAITTATSAATISAITSATSTATSTATAVTYPSARPPAVAATSKTGRPCNILFNRASRCRHCRLRRGGRPGCTCACGGRQVRHYPGGGTTTAARCEACTASAATGRCSTTIWSRITSRQKRRWAHGDLLMRSSTHLAARGIRWRRCRFLTTNTPSSKR